MDETSWQKGALFHVKMLVKYEIGAGSVSSGVRMWSEVKWSEVKWSEVKWSEVKDFI